MLILSSFLQARYAAEAPFSLSARLVFEQSYGGVDGDSASSAELYCLLSAITGVPIRQSLAVTGSVNQMGQVQAIGGANEKIEGYFDLCTERGLTGEQGVLIPPSTAGWWRGWRSWRKRKPTMTAKRTMRAMERRGHKPIPKIAPE